MYDDRGASTERVRKEKETKTKTKTKAGGWSPNGCERKNVARQSETDRMLNKTETKLILDAILDCVLLGHQA